MTHTIITQCRLCSRKFEETVMAYDDGTYLVSRGGYHPLEDGCPWCTPCWEAINRTAERLLALTTVSWAPATPPSLAG
ncbi:MAG: hypothetical protein ACK4K2_06385 [Dehalococcoidia bacterium]